MRYLTLGELIELHRELSNNRVARMEFATWDWLSPLSLSLK